MLDPVENTKTGLHGVKTILLVDSDTHLIHTLSGQSVSSQGHLSGQSVTYLKNLGPENFTVLDCYSPPASMCI